MGNLARRYGMEQPPPDSKVKLPAATAPARPAPAKVAAPPVGAPKAEKIATPRRVVAETEIRPRETKNTAETEIRKRGRPAKADADKPWIAAGLSRAAWYRQTAATKA